MHDSSDMSTELHYIITNQQMYRQENQKKTQFYRGYPNIDAIYFVFNQLVVTHSNSQEESYLSNTKDQLTVYTLSLSLSLFNHTSSAYY